jgi:hypothetical protein
VLFAGGDGGVVVGREMTFLSISPYCESVMNSREAPTIAVDNPSKILTL